MTKLRNPKLKAYSLLRMNRECQKFLTANNRSKFVDMEDLDPDIIIKPTNLANRKDQKYIDRLNSQVVEKEKPTDLELFKLANPTQPNSQPERSENPYSLGL